MKTSRRYAGQRGISMVLVIILVIATMLLCFVSLVMYGMWVDAERAQKGLTAQLTLEQNLRDIRQAEIIRQLPPTGLFKAGTDPKELTDAASKAELDNRSKYLISTGEGGDAKAAAHSETRIYSNLQSLVEIASGRMMVQHSRVGSLKNELENVKAHLSAREASKPEMLKSKEAYIADLKDRIAKLTTQIATENTQFNDRKATLTTQRDEANESVKTEDENFKRRGDRLRGELSVLVSELEELKAKDSIKYEITVAHGHVMTPDVPNKSAFIDLGSRDRVVAGLRFLVAKRGDGGKFVYKAVVDVKRVWMTYSQVAISSILDNEIPVIDGDLIVNPLFNPRRPVIVAIAGEQGQPLSFRPAWSANEVTRRITEMGSTVAKEPRLDVDFVIWTEGKRESGGTKQQGPNFYAEYKTAVLLEIPIADAADIYRFLGN